MTNGFHFLGSRLGSGWDLHPHELSLQELHEENVIGSLLAPCPLPAARGHGQSSGDTALLAQPAAGPMKQLFQRCI